MGYIADVITSLTARLDNPLTKDSEKPALMRELAMAQTALGTGVVAVGGATVRTINRATLLNNPNNLLTEFQSAYDAQSGINAPDTVPTQIIAAANALGTTSYKIYLGHSVWWYTNTQSSTLASWTSFGGSKSNFAAVIPANHIFTFK